MELLKTFSWPKIKPNCSRNLLRILSTSSSEAGSASTPLTGCRCIYASYWLQVNELCVVGGVLHCLDQLHPVVGGVLHCLDQLHPVVGGLLHCLDQLHPVVGGVLHCLDQLHPVQWSYMCRLDLPIRNLSCYTFPFKVLPIVYWVTDMIMVDRSGYWRLITTKSACYSYLGNPPTIIYTAQRRSSHVKRCIDQTIFDIGLFVWSPHCQWVHLNW